MPAVLLIAASAVAAPSRGPSTELGSSPSQCGGLQRGTHPVNVHWSSIRTRPAGCFFFSGPGELGRDNPLGTTATLTWRGPLLELHFGAVTFTGRRTGARVVLSRQSTHAFSGDWRVTERMQGTEAQVGPDCRGLRLTYGYEECQDGQACPGQCRLDAQLTVTAR